MQKELADLQKSFAEAMASGEIEEYSSAWYEMRSSINDVEEAIAEANVQLLEFAQTMREIEWGHFDYLQDRISQLTQEADFLIDLMSNSNLYQDNGQFNDKGMATMGLHAQNYNVYMAQADQYAEEILALDKEIANNPYNKDLIARREELLELQRSSILAAEDEKQAIIDMVEEGIRIELDALKDLIDAYKESFDSAKSLYDFQKKIEKQTKNIASLEKQLKAYEGRDNSEETRATIQKLKVNLEEAQEDLAETEYEQFVSDTKKMLDNLYDDYEHLLNERLDDVDALLSEMIDSVNANSDSIANTIMQSSNEVGYMLTDEMRDIWLNNIQSVVTMYGSDLSRQLTSVNQVLSTIQSNVNSMIQASSNSASSIVGAINSAASRFASSNSATSSVSNSTATSTNTSATSANNSSANTGSTTGKQITVGGMINAGNAKIYSYAGDTAGVKQYFSDDPIYTVLDEQSGYLKVRWHKANSGVTGWFKKSDVKAYKTGGLVDYTGLAQLDGTPSKPELVLNSKDTENFIGLRDALRTMAQKQTFSLSNSSYGEAETCLSGLSDISNLLTNVRNSEGSYNTTYGDTNIEISIDHVDSYEDFVQKLQKDRQFEKMIVAMTTGRLAGGSSLAKNKFSWK